MMESRSSAMLIAAVAVVVLGLSHGLPDFGKRQSDGAVMPAFSAGLTSMLNVTDKTDVVYDRVFLNLGNGYDATTGVFTAKYNGTYIFLFHGLGETNGTLWLDLYKNDNYVTSAYAHVTSNYAAASNVVVLQLVAGDFVHIQGHGSSVMYGDPKEIYATFSGYLMFFKGNGGTSKPV